MSSGGIRWTGRRATIAGLSLLLVLVLIASHKAKRPAVAAGPTPLLGIGEHFSLQTPDRRLEPTRRARALDNVAQAVSPIGEKQLDEPRLFAIPPSDGDILRKLDMNQNRSSAEALSSEPPLIRNSLIDNGGLGNQLFQYAGLLALAVKYNRYPVIPATNVPSIYQYFNVHMTIISHAVDWSAPVISRPCVGCFTQFEELEQRPGDNRVVHAYFQSWKYVEPIRRVLQSQEFRYKPHIRNAAAKLMSDIRCKCKTSPGSTDQCIVIGVHNRRGDVLTKSWTDLGFPIADVDYFNRTMSFYTHKYGNRSQIIFAIVSNDHGWSVSHLQPNLGSLFDIHVLETSTNPAVDNCFLTLCDHLIITSGTFGWWAGYLGRGDVVYMKNYPVPGTYLAVVDFPVLSYYYPEEWIPL